MGRKRDVTLNVQTLDPDGELDQHDVPAAGLISGETVAILPGSVIPSVSEVSEVVYQEAVIQIPFVAPSEMPAGFVSGHLDVRLTRAQSLTLKSVFRALHQKHKLRANGQHIDKSSHAIQWLLDEIHARMTGGLPSVPAAQADTAPVDG